MNKNLRVALVHDWLVTYRGGERVLESIGELFPDAPIYTLFYDPSALPDWFKRRDVRYPKFLNSMKTFRKALLPILPSAIESFDLQSYDLIISTSSCVAKGIIPPVHAKHICYIHSPMRYIWDQRKEYFRSIENVPLVSGFVNFLLSQLRVWDVVSSHRVDQFIANSNFVKQRVSKYYARDASVIHPPVSLEFFQRENLNPQDKENYFLVAGAFVPYKRLDLAIQACNKLGHRLVVAGSGPSESYLRSLAKDKVEFVIDPTRQTLKDLMYKAKALIFPGVEDFGIVPIEAMASGTPVLALKQGGALDFLQEGRNGLFFNEQSEESLMSLLNRFKVDDFNLQDIVKSTERFSKERFLNEMRQQISRSLGE